MPRLSPAVNLACLTLLGLLACSQTRKAPDSLDIGSVAMSQGYLVWLDLPLVFTFDAPIDPATVTAESVHITAIEGPGVGTPARGTWRVRGSSIEFLPDLPHKEPLLTSGGLLPDTIYLVEMLGGDLPVAVRTLDGRWLADSPRVTFRTRTGSLPQHVFGHIVPGPPRLTNVTWSPSDAAGHWGLGGSSRPASLRLDFDQLLDPSADNLPRAPTQSSRGPIALVYDDIVYGVDTWIAADITLERNTIDGATVLVRPRGMLPSAAQLRLSVSGLLRDLFGETRGAGRPEAERIISTETAFEPQRGALAFDFSAVTAMGEPDFAEVPAVIEDGVLRVPDAFPELADVGDWSPIANAATLRTDTQTLLYGNGRRRTFEGGVLHMKNLHIGTGAFVRGIGPNPLVLVVDGDAYIDGRLSVRGTNALNPYIGGQYRGVGDMVPPGVGGGPTPQGFPTGPAAGAAGGSGAAARTSMPWSFGTPGISAPGTTGGGGQGGGLWALACGQAPGGGGGGGAVPGDPWYPTPAGPGQLFPQPTGHGGAGCGRSIPGASPGSTWFSNASPDDDFFGRAYVPQQRRTIVGELAAPVGGSGGGSGGSLQDVGSWIWEGGDGGGGGGAIVLQVRGTLTIGPNGRIDADGGHGMGGGTWYIQPNVIGGGGGGAGGMVVLMAGDGIVIHSKGETFANRDYDFPISADGGICQTSAQYSWQLRGKYPQNGQGTVSSLLYDSIPLGGFGGMGLVQLMVPVGRDNDDGTNTVLDDAITIVRHGVPLSGPEKQRYLSWRGFRDANGVFVDDFGNPTGTIGGQGDIRPDPMLMPVPYTTRGTARARSEWLPLGALFRRSLASPDGLARGVVGANLAFERHARADGWLPFGAGRLLPETSTPGLLPNPAAVAAIVMDTDSLDRPAYRVDLTTALPATDRDAFAGFMAVLGQGGQGVWTRTRVIASSERSLFLGLDHDVPINAPRLQLHAWSADLAAGEAGSYLGAGDQLLPRANARIGFAFHRDPQVAVVGGAGFDPERFPPETGTFLFDLSDAQVRAVLRAFGPRHLQWDVTLDGEFRTGPADQPPRADAGSRLGLRRFWLPVSW